MGSLSHLLLKNFSLFQTSSTICVLLEKVEINKFISMTYQEYDKNDSGTFNTTTHYGEEECSVLCADDVGHLGMKT